MCKVKDQVGWAPPSYLKKVDRGGESGESDSDDDYLGLPGGESQPSNTQFRVTYIPLLVEIYTWKYGNFVPATSKYCEI